MDITPSRIATTCLLILTMFVMTVALYLTQSVTVPLVLALFVYTALSPFLRWQHRYLKIPRYLAFALTSLVFLAVSALIVLSLVNSIQGFVEGMWTYQSRFLEFVEMITGLAARYRLPVDFSSIEQFFMQLPMLDIARNVSTQVLSMLGKTFLIMIFVLFLLLGEKMSGKRNLFVEQIQAKIGGYIATKSLISLVTGVAVGLVLSSLNVELAFMFGFLTFLLNFIPSIGSMISTLLPVPVIYLQFGLGWQLYGAVSLLTVIQFTLGNIIEPKMMGDAMDLHPVVVLVSLLFWGLVWGLAGMFLAVPMTAVLKIVFDRLEPTQFLGELLAGRI